MDTSLPDALEVVSFMAGGYRFAVEAGQVRTQLSAKHTDAAPTAEQLLGLSGGETQNHSSRRTLVMKHPAGDYAVTVSGPVELLGLRLDAIHPLPPLIAARNMLAGIRGLAIGTEGVTILVDFRAARPSAQ
jgi:hypothetical protein